MINHAEVELLNLLKILLLWNILNLHTKKKKNQYTDWIDNNSTTIKMLLTYDLCYFMMCSCLPDSKRKCCFRWGFFSYCSLKTDIQMSVKIYNSTRTTWQIHNGQFIFYLQWPTSGVINSNIIINENGKLSSSWWVMRGQWLNVMS